MQDTACLELVHGDDPERCCGEQYIIVNYSTAWAFSCLGCVTVNIGVLSTMVCGMTRMKLQTIYYSAAMIARFVLAFVFAKCGGAWDMVVWSTVIVLLPYCVIQHIDLVKYINNKIRDEDI